MSDQYLGEIRLAGFGFPPKGWAVCAGQLLTINQNQALFSLLGTNYGGNGTTTFGLPDLRGRVAIGAGQGPGLGSYFQGQFGGEEQHTLSVGEMAPHIHSLTASGAVATNTTPGNMLPAVPNANARYTSLYGTSPGNAQMDPSTLATAGGSQSHENRQPILALNYIIALTGIFPSRP